MGLAVKGENGMMGKGWSGYMSRGRKQNCGSFCVPSMALIVLVKVQSRVFTAKCSEPQVGASNGMDICGKEESRIAAGKERCPEYVFRCVWFYIVLCCI